MGKTEPRGEERRWFEAARTGTLLYQQCTACDHVPDYPRAICSSCWSTVFAERVSAGMGRIHSFTTQYRSGSPDRADDVPYTLGLIDMDEGFRLLVDLGPEGVADVAIGQRVTVRHTARPDPPTTTRLVATITKDVP